MKMSLIDSTVSFNPSLSESDDEENSDTEDNAEPVYKQKKRYNGVARRKIEEYLEMKNLEQQTQDIFYDDLFLDNG